MRDKAENSPEIVCRSGSARTRWGRAYSASLDRLAGLRRKGREGEWKERRRKGVQGGEGKGGGGGELTP